MVRPQEGCIACFRELWSVPPCYVYGWVVRCLKFILLGILICIEHLAEDG